MLILKPDIDGAGGVPPRRSIEEPQPPSLSLSPGSRTALARRKRDHRLRRFRRELLKVAPHLDDPKYTPLLNSFGRLSILSLDGYELLRSGGLLDGEGELRRSVETFSRLAAQQLKFATALGLSPASLGKIRKEKPDLAAAFAEIEDGDEA